MNSGQTKQADEPQRSLSGRIFDVGERFEAAWREALQRGDAPPVIQEFFGQIPASEPDACRRELMVSLVLVDIEYRWRLNAKSAARQTGASVDTPTCGSRTTDHSTLPVHPLLEDYVARYDGLGPVAELQDDVIAEEYRLRHRIGDRPDHAEYMARFNNRATLLSQLMAIDRSLVRAGGENRDDETPDSTEAFVPSELGDLTSSPTVRTLSPGERIGHFVVRKPLGSGGFGTVYLADDEQLQRPVALKLPHPTGFQTPEDKERLLAEARAEAGLRHAGIVSVYHVGEQADGTPYIVMEYVDGQTLKDLLSSGKMAPRVAARLLSDVAEAVHHAHKCGLVHRDLKPSNILVDREGRPHVVDFGLAVHERMQRMKIGGNAGTWHYMAPEQARGEWDLLDGRADIWALGVVLYEMLTGRWPFDGPGGQRVREEILRREPKPLRQIDDTIPVELERICLKCLAKLPSERYATAADLARDLRRWLQPRRRFLLAAGLVAAAVLVIGVWLTRSRDVVPPTPVPPAPLPALSGTIDVLVWNEADASRKGLTLHDSATLPLRAGDQIRVEARLKRRAFVYLVLLDTEGKISPIYPWRGGEWSARPPNESPVDWLSLPEMSDESPDLHGWDVDGPTGAATVLLLARETPLAKDLDPRQLFTGISSQPMPAPDRAIWFADGRPITPQQDKLRGFDLSRTRRISDELLNTQRMVHERLVPYFECIRAVVFPQRGN